jgi:hypothetical protein
MGGMKTLITVLAMGLAMAGLLAGTGCEQRSLAAIGGSVAQPKGKVCTVQLRRDALGSAAASPVPPLTGSINGVQVAITGKVLVMDSEWVMVATEKDGTIYIPKEVVLLVQER